MRVAIAEDSVLLREGLARLLADAGFEVVAHCDNADDLLLQGPELPAGRGDRGHPAAARRTPTRAARGDRDPVAATRTWACSSSPSTSRSGSR